MSSYPKWLYHATKGTCVVPDEAAHKAAGEGWAESPDEAKAAGKARLETELAVKEAELKAARDIEDEPVKPEPKHKKGK